MHGFAASRACARCGQALAPEDRFCMACGHPAAAAAWPRRRWAGLLLPLVAVALAGAAAGGAWWYWTRPRLVDLALGLRVDSQNQVVEPKTAFLNSDILAASVAVKNARAGTAVTARWQKDGADLHVQTARIYSDQKEARLVFRYEPPRPLAPGNYLLQVGMEGTRPLSLAFQVKAAPPPQVAVLAITATGPTRGDAISSAASALHVQARLSQFHRFTEIEVVWKHGESTLKRDQFVPDENHLRDPSQPITLSYSYSPPRGSLLAPGPYRVEFRDEEGHLLAIRTAEVFRDLLIGEVEMGERVSSDGKVTSPDILFFSPPRLYASVRVEAAHSGTELSIEWYRDGQLLPNLTQTTRLTRDTINRWVYWGIQNPFGIPTGRWEVVIKADGKEVARKAVRIY